MMKFFVKSMDNTSTSLSVLQKYSHCVPYFCGPDRARTGDLLIANEAF